MKRLLLAYAIAILSGCATNVAPVAMNSDWRSGTDFNPYRSIPSYLLCDDCAY